jgi:hypothetical protein
MDEIPSLEELILTTAKRTVKRSLEEYASSLVNEDVLKRANIDFGKLANDCGLTVGTTLIGLLHLNRVSIEDLKQLAGRWPPLPAYRHKVLTQLETKVHLSFSNVKYTQIAPIFGPDPTRSGRDIPKFKVQRSFIPKSLFARICSNLDSKEKNYGYLEAHKNEQMRSSFCSGLFEAVVDVFEGRLNNQAEVTVKGGVSGGGCIEYNYVAWTNTFMLLIEMKLSIGNQAIPNYIAQVMAECDGKPQIFYAFSCEVLTS